MTGKPKLAISFSGGRSSAVMLLRCLERFDSTHEIVITFANTGCEHEETLKFVDAVNRNWAGGRVVWLEAVINPTGEGVTAKIVNYETASRNGKPFEDAIKKHGIFGPKHPQCTARLKTELIEHHIRHYVGWNTISGKRNYDRVIGIRSDEADRVYVTHKG